MQRPLAPLARDTNPGQWASYFEGCSLDLTSDKAIFITSLESVLVHAEPHSGRKSGALVALLLETPSLVIPATRPPRHKLVGFKTVSARQPLQGLYTAVGLCLNTGYVRAVCPGAYNATIEQTLHAMQCRTCQISNPAAMPGRTCQILNPAADRHHAGEGEQF